MKRRLISIFLFILIFPFPIIAQQELDSSRFGDYIEEDLNGFTRSLTIRNFVYTGASTGALYLLSFKDEDILEAVQNKYKGWIKTYLDITNEFGNPIYVLPGAGGIFGISMLTNDTKFQDAAFTSLESVAVSLVFVGAIKSLVGRARPFERKGAHFFHPFTFKNKYNSFPSGHTSTAFAFSVPWLVYYPNIFTYSLILIPTGTAFARIAKDKHWFTDVIAGGLIGALTGYWLAKSHEDSSTELKKDSSKAKVMPLIYFQMSCLNG